MRFETNTIGTLDAVSEDNVRRAFENREPWDNADWAGNVYTLVADDGARLAAISGPDFRDFTLAFTAPDGATRRRSRTRLTAHEVADRFIRFLHGDRSWLADEAWDA